MEPTREFVRRLFELDLEAAERMPPAKRFRSGPELFDFACKIGRAGIRGDYPQADEAEVMRIQAERMARIRKIAGAGSEQR